MNSTNSVVFAQSLLAAITLTYGSAYLGLWLQYRRDAMRAFAFAWLGLGSYSGLYILTLLLAIEPDAAPPSIDQLLAGLLVLVSTGGAMSMVNASYAVAHPGQSRRHLLPLGGAIAATLIAMALLRLDYEFFMGLAVIGALLWALAIAWRAEPSPGRLSMVVAMAVMLMRPLFGMLAPSWQAGQQPVWYTVLQVFATITSGFLFTVSVFAIEREATVADRVVLERGLAQSQRMDSLGRMASSVAHDFNNILASVLSASEFADDPDATAAERTEAAKDIMAAVQRGKDLTRALVDFGRPVASGEAAFDPVPRLDALLPMIERLIGRRANVSCSVADGLRERPVALRADAVQFDQMMLNLAANARDAMPEGGQFAILCDVADSPRLPDEQRHLTGPHLRIVVVDQGAGMTREVAEHIFEPFFTTKAPGKGTGLGLATAFSFVRQAKGEIRVQSAPGRGTTFSIYLPV